jgi:hypothetical protein
MKRYSSISCHKQCPYKYKLQYVDELETIFNQDADNPLTVGTMFHLAIETDLKTAINWYYSQYNIIKDEHINKVIKLEILYPKIIKILNELTEHAENVTHELKWQYMNWEGTADLLIDDLILDFKYCSPKNVEKYLQSEQLHIYMYFLNKLGYEVKKLGFIFIPKTFIRQKKEETIEQFRNRLIIQLKQLDVNLEYVEYNEEKVLDFITTDVKGYEKNKSKLCDWCEYELYCKKGVDYLLLPENKKKEKEIISNPDIWIYGDSYIGKSTFVDSFEDVIFGNTDGNVDTYTSPFVQLKEVVTYTGRLKNTKMTWKTFIEFIEELEKKQNTFKIVAIDLIEDLYEQCRLYIYNREKITHEQDAGFGKGWDLVRTEFLTNIKRLKNLGYRIIFISKEVVETVTSRSGQKTTTYKPNMNDKVANIITGLVDLTVRAYIDNDKHLLQLQKQDDIFGGGRFNFKQKNINLDKVEFEKALKESQENKRERV